jgi:hypothetical protein
MICDVEHILIPENYVRISVKTAEFDRLLNEEFCDVSIIYMYKGARYLFYDDDFVIEELIKEKR